MRQQCSELSNHGESVNTHHMYTLSFNPPTLPAGECIYSFSLVSEPYPSHGEETTFSPGPPQSPLIALITLFPDSNFYLGRYPTFTPIGNSDNFCPKLAQGHQKLLMDQWLSVYQPIQVKLTPNAKTITYKTDATSSCPDQHNLATRLTSSCPD